MKMKITSLSDLVKVFEEIVKEELCKEEPDTKSENPNVKVCDTEYSDDCKPDVGCVPDCPCSEEENEEENTNCVELSNDVFVIDENSFLISNKVDDLILTDNSEIVFSHFDEEEEAWVPGVTEEQLLTILLYKNRKNEKRFKLIQSLLFS